MTKFEILRIMLHERIDAMAEDAKDAIRAHCAHEIDRIKTKVGWLIRSSAQIRRYQNSRKGVAKSENIGL